MENPKFLPGNIINYNPCVAGSLPARNCKVVGLNDVHENVWVNQYCPLSDDMRAQRSSLTSTLENRYVIEYYNGWSPSLQKDAVKIDLDPNRRYYFAYESELSLKH